MAEPRKTKAQREQEEADRMAHEQGIPSDTDVIQARKESETRARAALNMAVAGATDDQIATLLKFASAEAARVAWEKALAGSKSKDMDFTSLRRLSNARYEAVLRSLAAKALNAQVEVDDPKRPGQKKKVDNPDHLAYAKVFLSTIDRINHLNGLNAPTVSVTYTPEAAEFNQVVERLTKAVAAGDALDEDEIEGDIFAEGDDGIYGKVEDDA